MKLVTAVIRPQMVYVVADALSEAGFNAFSKWPVLGRGRQKGIKVGDVIYEELPKCMLYLVVENKEKDEVVDIILRTAKANENGCPGDGKVFVTNVEEEYSISDQNYE